MNGTNEPNWPVALVAIAGIGIAIGTYQQGKKTQARQDTVASAQLVEQTGLGFNLRSTTSFCDVIDGRMRASHLSAIYLRVRRADGSSTDLEFMTNSDNTWSRDSSIAANRAHQPSVECYWQNPASIQR